MEIINYKEYLNTEVWKSKRKTFLEYYNYMCVICRKQMYVYEQIKINNKYVTKLLKNNLQIHHLNYNHLGCETQEDCIIVCLECHKQIHDKHIYILY